MISKRCFSWDFSDDQLDATIVGDRNKMSPQLVDALHACGFHRSSILAASFDNLEQACEVVQSLGIPRLAHDLDLMESYGFELVRWKDRVAQQLRTRRRRVSSDLVEGRVVLRESLAEKIGLIGSQILPSTLDKVCVPLVWKTRRSRKMAAAKNSDDRSAVEESERLRWGSRLVELIREAALPLVGMAAVASDPSGAMMSALGNLRPRTLRMRVKTWEKIMLWMKVSYQVPHPRHVGDMLEYLNDVLDNDCGKSVPNSIMAALIVLERTGGVPISSRISVNPMWVGAVAQAESAIKSVKGGVIRKASPFLLTMVISLELFVCSDRPKFHRGVAWLRLVKLWTCMRFDDTKGLRPSRLILGDGGLRGVLERTKTTGAGRRTGELPIFVHRSCGFSGCDWLRAGYEVWMHEDMFSLRDYMLPRAQADFEGIQARMADYPEASAWGRTLLRELRMPRKGIYPEVVWTEIEELRLFSCDDVALFFTEHSERHWIPSVSAALHVEKSVRDYAGRWGVDSSHQSNDYVVSARKIITGLQRQVCEALSTGTEDYDEEDILLELTGFLKDRGINKAMLDRIRRDISSPFKGGVFGLKQAWPLVEFDSLLPVEDIEESQQALDELLAQVPKPVVVRELDPSSAPLWYSVSAGRGFRRLHRKGGCGSQPSDCLEAVLVFSLNGIRVDARCLHCFPSKGVDEDAESEGSSESSSSPDSEEVEEVIPRGEAP
jgi:hypothetical protein